MALTSEDIPSENPKKLFPSESICIEVPKFLVSEENVKEWFPNSNLTQDSAMLLFVLQQAIIEKVRS